MQVSRGMETHTHTQALHKAGLEAEQRQSLRLNRAFAHYEEGSVQDAKRDLLCAARLDGNKNKARMELLGAKIAFSEGNPEEACALLFETWSLPGTAQDPTMLEDITLTLGRVYDAGGQPLEYVLHILADLGPRLENPTETCRKEIMRLAVGFLRFPAPAWAVPAVAITIARHYDRSQDDQTHLNQEVARTMVKFCNIDTPEVIEDAVAVAALLPILNGNFCEFDRLWEPDAPPPLGSSVFRQMLTERLDRSQRQRLVRFAKHVLSFPTLPPPERPRQGGGVVRGALQQACFNHGGSVGQRDAGRRRVMLSILERVSKGINDDGELRELRDLGK